MIHMYLFYLWHTERPVPSNYSEGDNKEILVLRDLIICQGIIISLGAA